MHHLQALAVHPVRGSPSAGSGCWCPNLSPAPGPPAGGCERWKQRWGSHDHRACRLETVVREPGTCHLTPSTTAFTTQYLHRELSSPEDQVEVVKGVNGGVKPRVVHAKHSSSGKFSLSLLPDRPSETQLWGETLQSTFFIIFHFWQLFLTFVNGVQIYPIAQNKRTAGAKVGVFFGHDYHPFVCVLVIVLLSIFLCF